MNAAVHTLEQRLENVSGRVARARQEAKRTGDANDKAQCYYRKLVQEEMDLGVALEELAALQQMGLIAT